MLLGISILFAIKSECHKFCTEDTWKLKRLSQKGAITMAIIVNTNLTALKTQKNLNSATAGMNTALQRMSTGYKINQAKDDAAGLYVATGLETQIRGSKVAQDNIATGNNVLMTAEGGLDSILSNLQRIRDLATQAANSIYDEDAMNAMKQEVDARIAEIERISKATTFNGLHLLDAEAATDFADGLRLQVGANADAAANSIVVPASVFSQTDCTQLGKTGSHKVNAGSDIADGTSVTDGAAKAFDAATTAASFIAIVSNAIDEISNKKSTIGAIMNRLESAEATLATTIENSTAAKSTIMDADIAEESMEYTKHQILQQTSSALLVQANALPQIAISLVQG